MHPLSERLFDAYYSSFASADREITWLHSEREVKLWLTPNTLLIGRVDAEGVTSDGQRFFMELKSIGYNRARYLADEKMKWRTDPQVLTYGVLVPDATMFTVRWVVKPDDRGKAGPRCDFEWYGYSVAETDHWREQLIRIAAHIRVARMAEPYGGIPWTTNFNACFRYGIRYACPFFERCSKQEWARSMNAPRTPHLAVERELDKSDPDLVVLDASRVSEWLECPEAYRRKYEGEGYSETSEALTIGTDLHSRVSQHINGMKREELHARTN